MYRGNTTPVMSIVYDLWDDDRNRVYGHQSRCYSLAKAWEDAGGTVFDAVKAFAGYPTNPKDLSTDWWWGDVLVVDKWMGERSPKKIVSPDILTVSICDEGKESLVFPDITVNHNFGAQKYNYTGQTQLLGPQYALLRKGFSRVSPQLNYKNIVLIPGGNRIGFLSQVDVAEIEEYVKLNGLGTVEILEKIPPKRFVDKLANAGLVITSSGVSALEALAMNKPVLLVKTARDQDSSYKYMVGYGMALPYSFDQFVKLLGDPHRQEVMSLYTERLVNKHGASDVVDVVYTQLKRKKDASSKT